MIRLRAAMCAALLAGCLGLATGVLAQQKADAVRPEVGKPLQEAQNFMKSGRHREAMAKVNEADAVSGKSAFESYMVQRMRGSVASAAGDNDAAIKAFEAVGNSGRVSGGDALQMGQAGGGGDFKKKGKPKGPPRDDAHFKESAKESAVAHGR